MLSGCYLFTGMPDSQKNDIQEEELDNDDSKRKKRAAGQNRTDMKSFCSRYAKIEPVKECKVNIKVKF